MADSVSMSFIRVLTIFASLVVLSVMLVLVFNAPMDAGFSEIITLVLVLGLTTLLAVLTYDPRAIWHSLVRFGSRGKERQDSQTKRMTSQIALYALVSGIILAIIQILSVSGSAGEMEKKLALWSLLYGVLVAVGLWVISGVDKPAMNISNQNPSRGDENQIILAFCVLLLTVGVLSLLFVEIQKVGQNQALTQTGELSADLVNTGLQLGDDMIWRPATFFKKDSKSEKPKQSPELAHGGHRGQNGRTSPGSQITVEPADAALRWELSLD